MRNVKMKKVKDFTNAELARELEYIPPYLMDAARKHTTSEQCLNEAAKRLRSMADVKDDGNYAGKCARLEKMLKDERRENSTLIKTLKAATDGLRKMFNVHKSVSKSLYEAATEAKYVRSKWPGSKVKRQNAGKRIGIH